MNGSQRAERATELNLRVTGRCAGFLFRSTAKPRTKGEKVIADFCCLFYRTAVLYLPRLGIKNWFYKNVTELSGGQKQLFTGFPLDLVQATATAFFIWFLSQPMLEKLDRIKVKYGLVEYEDTEA